ncbi:hypothetical protein [Ekhidna sp.]|uniref:hypothetical protein n=1 Tax=Ekhidna sp. TaxID=2608089 RepID=UPI003BAC5039
MIKSLLSFISIFPIFFLSAQNSEDIGYARPLGSSPYGLNINTPTNASGSGLDGSTNTNIQIATRAWSGSHAILFNSYASQSMVSGSLLTFGNTKFANNVGNYSSGAGAIMFFGNGGTMDFHISQTSTGSGTDIAWGTPKMRIKRDGKVGIGTTSPTHQLSVGASNSSIASWASTLVNNGIAVASNGNGSATYLYNQSETGIHGLNAYNYGTGVYIPVYIGWGGNKVLIAKDGGNVGIGTTTPVKKLDVNGDARIGNLTSRKYLKISSSEWPEVRFETPSSNEQIRIGVAHADNSTYNISEGDFYIYTQTASKMPLVVQRDSDVILNSNSGNVGIGTTNPDEKLTVKGTVHAREVKVDLSVPGPDYVFEPGYDLRSLEETAAYIKSNKHLPEVPSAKEMEANGVQLGEMNMLLLKKIEELTLYVIELKEENEKQQQEINRLKED